MEFNDIMTAFEVFDVKRDRSIKHIYAVQYDDGIVKIGITNNPKTRLYQLSRMRENTIVQVYVSGLVNHAYKAEKLTTKGLKARFGSEFFDIAFDDAVKRIQSVAGNDVWYRADNAENIRDNFPSTERTEDGLSRVFDTMIALCGIRGCT